MSLHSCSCYCSLRCVPREEQKTQIDSIYFDFTLFNIKKQMYNSIELLWPLFWEASGLIHNWSDNCIALSIGSACVWARNIHIHKFRWIKVSLAFPLPFSLAGLITYVKFNTIYIHTLKCHRQQIWTGNKWYEFQSDTCDSKYSNKFNRNSVVAVIVICRRCSLFWILWAQRPFYFPLSGLCRAHQFLIYSMLFSRTRLFNLCTSLFILQL